MNAKFISLGLIAAGIAAGALLAHAQSAKTFGDEDISLRKADMGTTTTAPEVVYKGQDPGENKKLGRAFYGAPPMIPHKVADLVVNRGSNDCLDCHGDPDEDTPGLPPSHKIKARFEVLSRDKAKEGMVTAFSGYGKADIVAGNRYDCLLCHAPQVSPSADLMDNEFTPVEPTQAQKDVLDQLNSVGKY